MQRYFCHLYYKQLVVPDTQIFGSIKLDNYLLNLKYTTCQKIIFDILNTLTSGIILEFSCFFQIGQFYSCMAIIVFECQRPKNVYQSSFRISSRKIFSYIPFFQNHSSIRVQGLTKIWLCCSFSFQHNM